MNDCMHARSGDNTIIWRHRRIRRKQRGREAIHGELVLVGEISGGLSRGGQVSA